MRHASATSRGPQTAAATDVLTPAQRRRCMQSVPTRNTRPELLVRRLVHAMGYRYRLHVAGLPGSPDLVLPRLRCVVEVRGCFWHRHTGCRYATTPKANAEFWAAKFEANVRRDRRNASLLRAAGWRVLVVWTCEASDQERLRRRLQRFLRRSEASVGDRTGRAHPADLPRALGAAVGAGTPSDGDGVSP